MKLWRAFVVLPVRPLFIFLQRTVLMSHVFEYGRVLICFSAPFRLRFSIDEHEWESPSFTVCDLPCRNSVNQMSKLPVIPYARSFIYVISQNNKLLLPYPPHLKLSPPYLEKYTNISYFFIFFHAYRVPIRDTASCGNVLLRHGLNFTWWTWWRGGRYSWSVTKKTGSMYPCRRWSLWTFGVTLLV